MTLQSMEGWQVGEGSHAIGVRAARTHSSLLQDKSTGTFRPHVVDGFGFFQEPSAALLPSLGRKLNENSGLLGTWPVNLRARHA